MNRTRVAKVAGPVIALALLLSGAPLAMGYFSPPPAPAQQSAGISFADPAFQSTWNYADLPVSTGKANRSWLWGPNSVFSGYEPWAESPGGKHLVQYFDKSRMEVNDPNADRNSQWFVTNGLLVVEMMTGKIATGVNAANQAVPAAIPVAGDVSSSVNAPTYATTAGVASLNGNNRAPDRTGQPVNQILDRNGNVSTASKQQNTVVDAVYEPTLGHNIPNVFWTFMNQTGVVYKNGQYVTAKVFDWVFAMGYALTEPYWIQISVGGKDTWVVMQAFQRRILTYNPNNDPAFQVEMGNVGQQYYDWRYKQSGQVPATPVPAATPKAAAMSISPSSGPANTTITVSGTGFTPGTAVVVSVVSQSAGYNQPVSTVGADGAGNFNTYITLPGEVAKQPNVVISAAGPNGVPTLTQVFTIGHTPSLSVSPMEVTNKGVLQISGAEFTANTNLTITAYQQPNNNAVGSFQVTTDSSGAFKQSYTLAGKAAVGASYTIVATGPNGLQAQAPGAVKVIPRPSVVVTPPTGPAGANIVFSGGSWPANRALQLSLQGDNGQSQTIVNPIVTDAYGNFATTINIPQAYAGQTKVTVTATDGTIGLSESATYTLTNPSPPKPNPHIFVVPNPIISSQSIQVTGAGYPANQLITVGVGVVGGPAGPVGTVSSNGNGDWSIHFNLASGLANAGMVTISATSTDGTNANTNVPVVNTATSGPYISVVPNPISQSQSIQVAGAKFPANSPVHVFISGANTALFGVADTTANATGDWSAHFTYPPGLASQTIVTVTGESANGTTKATLDVPVVK